MKRRPRHYYDEYLEVAEALRYGSSKEFNLMIHGSENRVFATERDLPFLVRKGELKRTRYMNEYIYMPNSIRSRNDMFPMLPHDLLAARCLARLYKSLPDGQIVPQREFFGSGVVPDLCINFLGGTALLGETTTKSNYKHTGVLRGKIAAYERYLPDLERRLRAKIIVLFLIDMPRETVVNYVGTKNGMSARSASLRHDGDTFPLLPLRFVDMKTFMDQPIGTHLQSKIYVYSNGLVDSLI